MDLTDQSRRAIALFQAALDKGNMTAAASVLKHLSDLHGLGRTGAAGREATERQGAGAEDLSGLSDEQLDALIQSLLP